MNNGRQRDNAPNMYMMCGISGSGKTIFSKQLEQTSGIQRLGIDDFYAQMNGDECNHTNTFNVWLAFFQAIQDCFLQNKSCIIDTNALTWHQRMQFIEWFPGFRHHIIFIDAPLELQKHNNQSRRRQVPDAIMNKMAQQLQKPTAELDTEWDSITYIENHNNVFQKPYTVHGVIPQILLKGVMSNENQS